MKVIFLASSAADVKWFTRYYRLIFPAGSPRARAWLERSLLLLSENPRAGRPTPDGSREYSVPKTPFSVVYRIADDRIEVLGLSDKRANRGSAPLVDEGSRQA
jgi:plasmid stabilization system protein ParE